VALNPQATTMWCGTSQTPLEGRPLCRRTLQATIYGEEPVLFGARHLVVTETVWNPLLLGLAL
jgi:hypothetical protein